MLRLALLINTTHDGSNVQLDDLSYEQRTIFADQCVDVVRLAGASKRRDCDTAWPRLARERLKKYVRCLARIWRFCGPMINREVDQHEH